MPMKLILISSAFLGYGGLIDLLIAYGEIGLWA